MGTPAAGPGDSGLLAGLRVLDLSNYTPGPFATQILADLGATVLKVERPPHGDLERLSVPEYFHAYNRGKRSIALNLQDADDRAMLHKLVADADVLFEGFRPGVADRLGAGFDELRAIRPGLIYVSLPGVPSASPFAMDRAHDSEFQARIGALAVAAGDREPTYDMPYPVSDYAAGMYAVIAVLAALARPTGEAVHIEVPCFSAGLAWMFPMLCRLVYPVAERPSRGRLPGVGVFTTADGRHLTMSTIEDRGWRELCLAIGRPDLADDPGLRTLAQRKERFEELDKALRDAIARAPSPSGRRSCGAGRSPSGRCGARPRCSRTNSCAPSGSCTPIRCRTSPCPSRGYRAESWSMRPSSTRRVPRSGLTAGRASEDLALLAGASTSVTGTTWPCR